MCSSDLWGCRCAWDQCALPRASSRSPRRDDGEPPDPSRRPTGLDAPSPADQSPILSRGAVPVRPRRPFWRPGRIVRTGTPGGFNIFRMIPRFSQWCSRVRDGTILPGRHFSCLTPAVASAVSRPGGGSRRTLSGNLPRMPRRPPPRGIRFGHVTASRIVQDGLTRIVLVWIDYEIGRASCRERV